MENQKIDLHRVVITAIIVKDGKFLIARRGLHKRVQPGMWSVPGGGMELDDYINNPKTLGDCWYFAIEKTLKREVMEEVGVEIDHVKYLLDLAFFRPDGVPVVTLSFWCHWKSGEVCLNDESIDCKWVTLEEAKNYDLIPGIWGELEMVDKILQGQNPEEIAYNPK